MSGYFVTGTDTEIGKTYVSVRLMRALAAQGKRVLGMKPIAAGCEQTTHGLRNEDALALAAEDFEAQPYEVTNPYTFEPPIAPHLAAAEAGVTIDMDRIVAGFHALASQADCVVVEGAGGWLVPLDDKHAIADMAVALKLPVILVVGLRLGCINQALLSAQSIRAAGCELVGWVANEIDPAMLRRAENVDAIAQRIGAPLLGVVGFGQESPEMSLPG